MSYYYRNDGAFEQAHEHKPVIYFRDRIIVRAAVLEHNWASFDQTVLSGKQCCDNYMALRVEAKRVFARECFGQYLIFSS